MQIRLIKTRVVVDVGRFLENREWIQMLKSAKLQRNVKATDFEI